MNRKNSTKRVNKKDKEVKKNFARRFRILMAYHDVTLNDISNAIGYPISTVGTWRNGRIPFADSAIEKLADYLKVSVDFLVEGKLKRHEKRSTAEVVNQIKELLDELDDHTVIQNMLRHKKEPVVKAEMFSEAVASKGNVSAQPTLSATIK